MRFYYVTYQERHKGLSNLKRSLLREAKYDPKKKATLKDDFEAQKLIYYAQLCSSYESKLSGKKV